MQSLFVSQYLLEVYSNPKLSSIELTTYHNLGGRDVSGPIFRGYKEKIEIHSTYYPMLMIGKIFKNNVVRIVKERNEEVYLYKCFNKDNIEILSYKLDWKNYNLSCTYKTGQLSETSMIYSSETLFKKADNLGSINFEVHKLRE